MLIFDETSVAGAGLPAAAIPPKYDAASSAATRVAKKKSEEIIQKVIDTQIKV